MANNMNDIPMTWDDEIENDGEGFRVLPAGEYDFTVTDFTRGRFEGSARMAACPKAELTIRLHDPDGDATVNHNLFLNRKCEWKLCQFFTSIGARRHGETLRMDWNTVRGAKGRCKVGVRKWTGNDGTEHESNEITAFLEPGKNEPSAPPTPPAFGNSASAQYTQEPLNVSPTQPRKWANGSF